VIRGDDHLTNTPRQIPIFQALGHTVPQFGHLPMILGTDKARLSKRHGATSVLAYKEMGYLPEAMVNYLALCGWSPGTDQDVLSLDEVVSQFSLDRVSRSGGIFDHAKLEWLNGVYIRSLAPEDLAGRVRLFLTESARETEIEQLTPMARLLQDRLRTLAEAPALSDYFFADRLEYDAALLIRPGMDLEQTSGALAESAALVERLEGFSHEELEEAFRALCARLGLTTAQLFMSIRVACTGKTATPPLFETMEVLGRERVATRLREAMDRLAEATGPGPAP
jgi:glutamyl-tRNA synthetase